MDVRDKVVIITGASGGIGLATARLFAQHGAKLALAARSGDKLQALAAELPGAFAIATDMADVASVKQMVAATHDHFGRIDILINNAGRGMHVPFEQIDLDAYRGVIELNVIGPIVAMQAVIPIMRAQGGGQIVNISSGVSKMYIPGLSPYASTKYALNALTLTARTELARDNIRVSIVYPGRTDTDFGKNAITTPGGAVPGGGRPGAAPTDQRGTPPGVANVDSPEWVAERILESVQSEKAEQYMHPEQEQYLSGGVRPE